MNSNIGEALFAPPISYKLPLPTLPCSLFARFFAFSRLFEGAPVEDDQHNFDKDALGREFCVLAVEDGGNPHLIAGVLSWFLADDCSSVRQFTVVGAMRTVLSGPLASPALTPGGGGAAGAGGAIC